MRCYINNRDILTWPKAMAEKLTAENHEVVFVDNASTYGPLLEFYKDCPYRVVRLKDNVGHHAVWKRLMDEILELDTEYVVTDPDLDISKIPDDWEMILRDGLNQFPHVLKCGFSLDDTRIPRTNPAFVFDNMRNYPNGKHPMMWDNNLRVHGKYVDFFLVPVDTTFALYRKGDAWKKCIAGTTAQQKLAITAVRTDEPYMARHLPWHLVVKEVPNSTALQIPMTDELFYYFRHAAIVSTTKTRMAVTGQLQEYAINRGNNARTVHS